MNQPPNKPRTKPHKPSAATVAKARRDLLSYVATLYGRVNQASSRAHEAMEKIMELLPAVGAVDDGPVNLGNDLGERSMAAMIQRRKERANIRDMLETLEELELVLFNALGE